MAWALANATRALAWAIAAASHRDAQLFEAFVWAVGQRLGDFNAQDLGSVVTHYDFGCVSW